MMAPSPGPRGTESAPGHGSDRDLVVAFTERRDELASRALYRREAIKKARRDARTEPTDRDDVPTARVPVVEHQLDIERAIARLPDGYRDVVVLHYVHGYPHREIARMLGIAPGTSKSQASRGIRRLRATLGWSE